MTKVENLQKRVTKLDGEASSRDDGGRTLTEQLQEGAERLKANPWLRWVEGLTDDPVVDQIMAQLSIEERIHLSEAIRAFDKANAAPDAVLTAPLADLPGEQRTVIEKVRRLSQENEQRGE